MRIINVNNSGNKSTTPGGPQKPKFGGYWIYILIAVAFLSLQFLNFGSKPEEIDLLKLETLIKQGKVTKLLVVNKESVEVFLTNDSTATQPQKVLVVSDRRVRSISTIFFHRTSLPQL